MELLALESIVKTQLSVRVPRLLNNSYPTISFTTEVSDKVPSFPNVYIHELEPSEVGNSLENHEIHAVRDTIQIEVSTNTSKSDARVVANACVRAMKALSYGIVVMPTYLQVNNVHRFVIRTRRIVASGDKL